MPLAEGDVHDLDAMAAEVTAATQLRPRLQPQQPDRHPPAGGRDRRLLRAACPPTSPSSSTRPTSSSRPTTTPTRPSTCSPSSPTWSSCAPSARSTASPGLRVGYAIGSAKFRAAVDAVRQPFSVNALAQAAGAEAILHSDDVARRVESDDRRAGPGRGGAATRSGLATAETPGQLLLDRPRRRRRGGGRRRPRRAPDRGPPRHAPRRPRPPPGHLRHRRRERPLPRGARRAARLKLSTLPACYKVHGG